MNDSFRAVPVILGILLLAGCAPAMMKLEAPHSPALNLFVRGDAPAVGSLNAPVTVFSFLSTASPEGRALYTILRKYVQQAEGKVRWVARSKTRGSSAARAHSRALMAAQAQGKYWEFADRVADSKTTLNEGQLMATAEELGLNPKAFEETMTSPLTKARMDADSGYALKLGVTGQSAVWVNGRRMPEETVEALQSLVAEELKKGNRLASLEVPVSFISPLLTDLNRQTKGRPVADARRKSRKPPMPRLPIGYSAAHLGYGATEAAALVTLVVFHDYQCGFCKRHDATLLSLAAAFPDRVRIVIRHNPLKRHAYASQAAAAALAAVEFGEGEQFHKALVELKVPPSDGQLQYLAAVAAIDPSLLQKAMERHAPLVEQDIRDALTLEARGTPHTFVNGRRVKGAVKRSTLLSLVQEELLRAERIQRESGLTGRALYDRLVRTRDSGKVKR